MVLGGPSSARVHTIDRFYNPPAVRRQLQLQQQKLQEQQQQQKPAKLRPKAAAPPPPPPVEVRESGNRSESDDSSSKPSVSSSSSASSPRLPPVAGNLDRFLDSTTPTVPALYLSKTSVRGWTNHGGVESYPYFNLGDLWEAFREWSAYGAGVPLVLNGCDSVVQYYVPFLSAIQIYVDPSRPSWRSRRLPGEESDCDTCQDTSSEESEIEADQILSERRDCPPVQPGLFSDDADICSQPGRPIFEYVERVLPHGREPLADKISALASKFPDLKTYRSCDLHPSSWMSVAWYPIYRIPIGPTLRDLEACFLTFHSLATPFRSSSNGYAEVNASPNARGSNSTNGVAANLRLPVFGLASYKFKGSIWTLNGLHERQLATSLHQAADNWLRVLQVDHPDFRFFVSSSSI